MMKPFLTAFATVSCTWLALLGGTPEAKAQEASAPQSPSAAEGAEGQPTPAPGGGVIYTPGTTNVTTTYTPPFGFPAPGTNINAGLPSSSQPTSDATTSRDGFDLSRSGAGSEVQRGSRDAPAILAEPNRLSVPRIHSVKKGDTLWDLCGTYYQNPWKWPEVWAYNPQVQNPHWIYPGDQLRMRRGGEGGGGGRNGLRTATGFLDHTPAVPPGTVFLQNYGFLGDPKRDTLGMLVGSREDQMLLSSGNTVYMKIRPGAELTEGQDLTIFRDYETPSRPAHARNVPGRIVAVKGTVRITSWNPKTRVARGKVLEALDVIERGAKVGPVGRRFDEVPPKPSTVAIKATVLTAFYPHINLGQGQLAFIDRGSEDGIEAGNRLQVIRRGDAWRSTLGTTHRMARTRVRLEAVEHAQYETIPLEGSEADFPDESVAELHVLRTQKQSSLVLVVSSAREIVAGDQATTQRGR